ncbi:DUF3108 domain-containing protein [Chryseobacterium pennipullorum]|uniref:Outer membrane lipoprotein-sorting protein n=1 Tax=Chryseobacterium pennipullorum TaxID=2258963 RepID=A0A3D9B348_9FLAO|nr:hypothetical protein [Chryseobacterium pennipullorum]REC48071.1 hypothetical protein DRF67_09290 [Chryseobacterium pennipullorum]
MRTFIFLLLSGTAHLFSQNLLSPKNIKIDPNLIQNEVSESIWYLERDGKKLEFGRVITELRKLNSTDLLIKTNVKMKPQRDVKYVDSSVVKMANFQPVYHSSFNPQRAMELKFGKTHVTGYHSDRNGGKKENINIAASNYFDSSIYPILIRLLPLKEDYTAEISIFDYNPNTAKKGIMKAYILDTKKSEYKGKPVWIVKTTDDISDQSSSVTYYIDPQTRKIVKQDMDIQGSKMSMEPMF